MRTLDQISKIKATVQDPYELKNILTVDEINTLVDIFKNHPADDKIYKNTGPITLDLKLYINHPLVVKMLSQIEHNIGPFEITAAFFFQTAFPHIIHNDDTHELPDNVYKAITVPLCLEGFVGKYPKLCFFDQFYFHGPSKFFNGDNSVPTYYNQQVYDYSKVDGISDAMLIDESTRVSYLTHLKSKWLHSLTFWGTLDWIPGNALVFDSTRLHCASDFRKLGIKSKLAISIFTRKL